MKGGRVVPGYERGFESLDGAWTGFFLFCVEVSGVSPSARKPFDDADFSVSCLSFPSAALLT